MLCVHASCLSYTYAGKRYTFGYLHICGHLSEGLEDAAFVPSVPEVGKPGRVVTGESHLFSLTTNVSEEDTASKCKALGE